MVSVVRGVAASVPTRAAEGGAPPTAPPRGGGSPPRAPPAAPRAGPRVSGYRKAEEAAWGNPRGIPRAPARAPAPASARGVRERGVRRRAGDVVVHCRDVQGHLHVREPLRRARASLGDVLDPLRGVLRVLVVIPERVRADRPSARERRLGAGEVLHVHQERPQVTEPRRHLRVLRAQRLLPDVDGSLVVRARLPQLLLRLVQERDVVEVDGHVSMVTPQGLLVYPERAQVKRLRLSQLPLGFV